MPPSDFPPLTHRAPAFPENDASKERRTLLSPRPGADGARLPPQLNNLSAFDALEGTRATITPGSNPFFMSGRASLDRYVAGDDAATRRNRSAGMKATSAIRAFYLSHPRGSMRSSLADATDMARQHVNEYPELNYLADTSVSITNEAAGGPVPAMSYSAVLGKPQHFVEFERSLLSLRCLNQIIDGSAESHQDWISAQTADKLQYSSFRSLSDRWCALTEHYAAKGTSPEQLRNAAQVALVLGDMGKAGAVRTMMADVGIHDADHDDFYGHVMREPRALDRLESFQQLSPAMQELLRTTANLAHFGHITHCEGGPQMFRKLKASDIVSKDPAAFEFAALVHMCDVAGALGHRNAQGSITLNQATFDAIGAAFDACLSLEHTDEVGAYEALLGTRAKWLGLSPLLEEDRMLARLGAMMRLTTASQGEALKKGFSKLSPADREKALRFLGVTGAGHLPRTPTYMPAVLVNLMNNRELGESPEQRLSKAIEIGVPFITFTLEAYQAMLAERTMPVGTPLDFNRIAAAAAHAPESLRTHGGNISPETGAVTI